MKIFKLLRKKKEIEFVWAYNVIILQARSCRAPSEKEGGVAWNKRWKDNYNEKVDRLRVGSVTL